MNSYYKELLNKINSNEFSVGVIGLGYVGLPLSMLFQNKKTRVIGFDVDVNKVKRIESGKVISIILALNP